MELFDYDDLPDGFDDAEFEQPPPDGRAETPPEVEQSPLFGGADLHEVPPSERPIRDLYEPNVERTVPLLAWRCLSCDSMESRWGFYGWYCNTCGAKEFYQTTSPAKKTNEQGTWMFLPHGFQGGSMPKSSKRRRKRRPGDPDQSELGERAAESETPTVDPVVDPDLHPEPQRRAGPQERPGHQGRFGRDLQEQQQATLSRPSATFSSSVSRRPSVEGFEIFSE